MNENVLENSVSMEHLESINVKSIMTVDVLTVYEGWSIRRLSQFFLKHNISGAPVIASDEELVGVVSQSDVVRFECKKPDEKEVAKIIEHYCGPQSRPLENSEIERIQSKAIDYMTVNSIMTNKVISISAASNLKQAFNTIIEQDVHRLFVTDKGVLVGVITAMDLLRYIAK